VPLIFLSIDQRAGQTRKPRLHRVVDHHVLCPDDGPADQVRIDLHFELDLTPEEWMKFYMKAIEVKSKENGIRISLDDPITASIHKAKEKPIVKGSTCGKLSLNIRANGDVTPCGFIPVTIGNLLTDDLKDIWNGSTVLDKMRNKKPREKCKTCRHYEDCLGGCSARAYAMTGDFNAPDPHCWVAK